MLKLAFLGVCAFSLLIVNTYSLSLPKSADNQDGDEKQESKKTLKSLIEFVDMVEKYNLNVSIIASQKKYASEGWVKGDMSLTLHMPVNDEHPSVPTLTNDKQSKYLKKLEKLASKENVGGKTRVITIDDGEDVGYDGVIFNRKFLIDSPGYESLTNFKNGVQGFSWSGNATTEIINYIIDDANDPVKRVQVIAGHIVVRELEVSEGFPAEVIQEIKNIFPKIYRSIGDSTLKARLLVEHLDKKFDFNHQALLNVDDFSVGKKEFAKLKIDNENILVFLLKE